MVIQILFWFCRHQNVLIGSINIYVSVFPQISKCEIIFHGLITRIIQLGKYETISMDIYAPSAPAQERRAHKWGHWLLRRSGQLQMGRMSGAGICGGGVSRRGARQPERIGGCTGPGGCCCGGGWAGRAP